MSAVDVPQQGQLVQVRERRWVVAEVEEDELPADPLGMLCNALVCLAIWLT